MTKHDFSDLTPPPELVRRDYPNLQAWTTAIYQAGAERAADRLKGQWPTPITDRRPTEADAFVGKVQYFGGSYWHVEEWDTVAAHEWPWAHSPRWQPPAPPTLKKQAMKALEDWIQHNAGHRGKQTVTLNGLQVDLIRRALEADS